MKIEKSKSKKSLFWGLLLIVCAVALLVNKMGHLNFLLGGLGVWQIVLTVFFVSCLVNGFMKHSFGQVLFSIAFLVIVNDELLHLEAITPWPVLGAALLGTIGLKFLFPNVKSDYGVHAYVNGEEVDRPYVEEHREGDTLKYENGFGEAVKYVSGEIGKVQVENSFGSLQVYFSDALLIGGSADISLENSFGRLVLYVPADWKVLVNVESTFGGVEEQGRCNPEGENVLYINGEVSFGKLLVRYI